MQFQEHTDLKRKKQIILQITDNFLAKKSENDLFSQKAKFSEVKINSNSIQKKCPKKTKTRQILSNAKKNALPCKPFKKRREPIAHSMPSLYGLRLEREKIAECRNLQKIARNCGKIAEISSPFPWGSCCTPGARTHQRCIRAPA